MIFLNRVELIGFLGADTEVRTIPGGRAVATLSVATTESWKDENDERKERTEWHRITVWAGLAETSARLKKGDHVRIEGKIRGREYEKDSVKVKTYEIVASSILKLDSAKADNE